MPRHAPLDAHGVPHDIILRAIEGRLIFRDDIEKKRLVEGMEEAFVDTRTPPSTSIHPNPLRVGMVQDFNDRGPLPLHGIAPSEARFPIHADPWARPVRPWLPLFAISMRFPLNIFGVGAGKPARWTHEGPSVTSRSALAGFPLQRSLSS